MDHELDREILKIFRKRKGLQTKVVLNDKREIRLNNVVFEYKNENTYALVTTNKNPVTINGESHTFYTNQVLKIIAIETGISVFEK